MDINKTSYIDWSTVPYCPIGGRGYAKFSVTRGDVFVIRMADPGKVGICEDDEEAVFASYLVRLRLVDDRVTPLSPVLHASGRHLPSLGHRREHGIHSEKRQRQGHDRTLDRRAPACPRGSV
jgi:hypothetical protein